MKKRKQIRKSAARQKRAVEKRNVFSNPALRYVLLAAVVALGIAFMLQYSLSPQGLVVGQSIESHFWELRNNLTGPVKEGEYYVYPLTLQNQTTVKFYLTSTNERMNTLFLDAFQLDNYKALSQPTVKNVKYFVDGSFWVVRSADFVFTAPADGTYYMLVGKRALVAEQSDIGGDTEINILVYELK